MATNGDKWRQNGSRWRMMVSAVLMMVMSNGVMAQNNPLPWDNLTEPAAYVTFNVIDSEWTLYPVITANSDFIGFFGYLPDEFVVGNNVSLLWLIPDNGDGTWSMYGWSNTDLKVVSDYLDNLTGTSNVLSDTGLDIFSGESQPIVDPKSMPNGIAIDDPTAPIMAATQDPAIASALIAAGAAGAPNLTEAINLQPVDCVPAVNAGGGVYTELDIMLATFARDVQLSMVIWISDPVLDSLEFAGLDGTTEMLPNCCFPRYVTVWLAWGPWSCSNPFPFINRNGVCRCTACSRTRTGTRFWVWPNCSVTTIGPRTDTQGPQEINGPVNPDGSCAACP